MELQNSSKVTKIPGGKTFDDHYSGKSEHIIWKESRKPKLGKFCHLIMANPSVSLISKI
jgi:hypothetical protein